MLLVVDFADLGLDFDSADIRLAENVDYSVGKLLIRLCDGVEQIGGVRIADRNMLDLLDARGRRVDASVRVSDMKLNDWDTISIVRRRS